MKNLLAETTIQLDDKNKLGEFAPATGLKVENMISGAIGVVLALAGLSFFFILVFGGIQWILSGGDKAKTEAARNKITAALVGLVIVFSAWAIITLIDSLFGVNLMKLTLPSLQ